MLLTLATGIVYFTFVVTGLSLSAGFAILIIGVPFFLAFIGMARIISLGEGRLLEAMTGERMPRRPVHPGPSAPWLRRIGEMLKDVRTWTTLLYLVLMLPLGIIYSTVAFTWFVIGLRCALAPLVYVAERFIGIAPGSFAVVQLHHGHHELKSPETFVGALFYMVLGILLLTLLLHAARAIARGHARLAKALLVKAGATLP
jgi:hypothetical protein